MSDIMQSLLNKIKIDMGEIKCNAVNIVEKIDSDQLLYVMIYIKNFLHTGKIDVLEDNGETDNFNLYLVRNGLSAIDLKRLIYPHSIATYLDHLSIHLGGQAEITCVLFSLS